MKTTINKCKFIAGLVSSSAGSNNFLDDFIKISYDNFLLVCGFISLLFD